MEESLSKLLGAAVTGAIDEKSRLTKKMLDLAALDHGLKPGTLKLRQIAETGAVAIVALHALEDGSLKNFGTVGSLYWRELESRTNIESEPSQPDPQGKYKPTL